MGVYTVSDGAAADLTSLTDGMVARGASLASADRFVDRLLESFQYLADFPDMGRSRSYLPLGLLAFPHQKHMLYYRKTAQGVEIARVVYGGMDMVAQFGKKD